MKMRTQSLFSSLLLMMMTLLSCVFENPLMVSCAPSVDQCNDEISKVGECLGFATGKSDKPTSQCCSTVKDIRDKKPVCLCFVIQQAHKGQSSLKQMGVQEAKLLQLPNACNLANASAKDCPKLLGLPPGSPDNAIFTNPSTNATSSSTSTSIPLPTAKGDSSIGFVHGPYLLGPCSVMVILIPVLHFIFPI